LNAVPTTPKEKEDCKKILTPFQLHQITIGTLFTVFKEDCSESMKNERSVTVYTRV